MPAVGLFIPCYIDQLYPQVGIATVDVLRRQKVDIDFPEAQTCCGQPMANTGCTREAAPLARRLVEIFRSYEHIVCPSGSCVAMVRHHFDQAFTDASDDLRQAYEHVRNNTFELCEYLTDVLKLEGWSGSFPHRVGIHQSCHGLRELRLGQSSEVVSNRPDKVRNLLATLDGIKFSQLSRADECCGFGGTFAIAEEAVSCMMGQDRIADHEQAGTEILTASDMSCLMHLEGLIRREKKNLRVMHVAEILAAS